MNDKLEFKTEPPTFGNVLLGAVPHITKGFVLVGDTFNKVGAVDYWSTSSFFKENDMNIPKHYDNSKGTLYKVATERGWNAYLFDIVKRLERAEKKGELKTDLEKSKVVIDLWLKESEKC